MVSSLVSKEEYGKRNRNERIFALKEPRLLSGLIAPVSGIGEKALKKYGKDSKYNLLLGAGCSVTSGIRDAGGLVKVWKREIFRAINEIDDDEFENRVSEFDEWDESPDGFRLWLEDAVLFGRADSEYGALFEYLKPSTQARRDYIEQILGDKQPGPGYIYLGSLISEGYFDTILTTNFDDLLESALRNYYGIRPIICSFDSEISSINIRSSRPKAIKMHGDYLFDNLKNTDEEILSLDENMERKIIELCDSRGLIVVGYAGRDASVMDPFFENLRRNKRFLDGDIHWCLHRPEETYDQTSITLQELAEESPYLAKLADRFPERVNFYKIRGFDQFFHDIFAQCGQELPPKLLNPQDDNPANDFLKACTRLKGMMANRQLPGAIKNHYDSVVRSMEQVEESEFITIHKAQSLWSQAKTLRGDEKYSKATEFYLKAFAKIEPLATSQCQNLENKLNAMTRYLGCLVGLAITELLQGKSPIEYAEKASGLINEISSGNELRKSGNGTDEEVAAGLSLAANSIAVIGIHDKAIGKKRSHLVKYIPSLIVFLAKTADGKKKIQNILKDEENATIIAEIKSAMGGKGKK